MNRLTAIGVIAELMQHDHERAAIVTGNVREVVDTFRERESMWADTILDIKSGHGLATIRFKAAAGANVLYVFDENAARTSMRGLSLAFAYIDCPLSPHSDFYRELAARAEEIIQA